MKREPFALTDADRHSPLWERLERHFNDRIADLRAENDNQALTDAQTAFKRGQIQTFKELVRLGLLPRTEELPPR